MEKLLDTDEVATNIVELLAENLEFEQEFTAETPFAEAGLDSLMMLELAVVLERRYKIRFSEEELLESGSVAAVVAKLRDRLAAV